MAKDTFYFSHDYNSRSDVKIKKLIQKHGYLGYGIFWAIIEDLYNNANALRTDYEGIAFDLRADEKTIKSIITDFDLFVFEDTIFGSLSVQKRLEERNLKSVSARISALKRWGKDANALRTECEGNAIKEKKGKEIKYNFYECLLDYGFLENLVNEWLVIRKTKKASNTETAFKGFIQQVELTGLDKNEVLRICVERSWSGLKAEWIKKEYPNNGTGKMETFLNNIKTAENL